MIITKLLKKGKKVVVEFQDCERIILSYEIVLKFALSANDELSEDKLNEITYYDKKFLAKQSAFRILSRRAHSKKELYNKLVQREFEPEIIEEVIGELIRDNFLNDKAFTQKFVESRSESKKQSPLKLKSDLLKKGISSSMVDEALEKFYPEEILIENIKKHVSKKIIQLKQKNISSNDLKNKVVLSLQYKGFSRDLIFRVLKEEKFEELRQS